MWEKRQQSHETERLEDKVGQLKRTNKKMKQKSITLQHQQDDQTNLMTQNWNSKGNSIRHPAAFPQLWR